MIKHLLDYLSRQKYNNKLILAMVQDGRCIKSCIPTEENRN